MSAIDRFVEVVTERSALVVVVMLLLTAGVGAGMTQLDDAAGLDQFEFETEESDALDYINDNFEVEQNQTTVQIVLRDEEGNVLDRESLIETIELQQEIREDEEINETLSDEPFADVGSIVATTAIQQEQADDLEQRQVDLEEDQAELEATAGSLTEGINETRELEREFVQLNASFEAGEIDEESYEAESERIEDELDAVAEERSAPLDGDQAAAYAALLSDARSAEADLVRAELAFEAGDIDEETRDERMDDAQERLEAAYAGVQGQVLADELADLEERGEAIQEDADALQELDPSLEDQREQLESMNDSEVEDVVDTVLGEDASRGALVFVPTDFEPGSGETDARQLFITQSTEQEEIVEGEAPERILDSQLAIADLVDDRFGDDAFVFGVGIISDEIDRSMADSIAIVLPLALLFVVVVLTVAYRDLLDILLGVLGIALVLVWTFGFMGWAGIAFNQIMIAVPVLLVGLSIDYAIHVFMRHREQRAEDRGVAADGGTAGSKSAMRIVLVGLGAALLWVTITAVIGFLSNLVSPVAPIREFGLVSAVGIAATFLIFGTFVPAAKVGLDSLLEARGWDRHKRAFGTGGGAFSRALSGGRVLAQRAPIVVVVIALVLTAGGLYGAANVDTEFQQEDFIADDPPEWTNSLPEPFAPGEYSVKQNLEFVNERFLRQDTSTQVLMPGDPGDPAGDVTSDDSLERIGEAEDLAAEQDVVVVLSDDNADVRSPLSEMESLADANESFNETFHDHDTTGDGIPDENVTAVYDAFFETAPEQAGQVLVRTDDGEYEAARMVISIQGDASSGDATDATRDVAASLDDDDGPTGIATGQLVVFSIIEQELFNTVLESLLVTLVAVFAFLMVAYRLVHGSAALGAITLTPIVLAVAWILGTMYLLDVPFNVMTGTITSLTIGLGVAYNIHMSERYRLELTRGHGVWGSLERAVTGTGGALLGSAATTVGGFGVLVFAILPPLQQFGLITGITIIYAFLGSVFVLPSLLVLWTRHFGPAGAFDEDEEDGPPDAPAAGEPAGDEPTPGATADPGDDPAPGATADSGGDPAPGATADSGGESTPSAAAGPPASASADDSGGDGNAAGSEASGADEAGTTGDSGVLDAASAAASGAAAGDTTDRESTDESDEGANDPATTALADARIGGVSTDGVDAVADAVPERSIEPAFLETGGSYRVEVTVPVVADRTILRESPPGSAWVEDVEPEPVDAIATDDRVYVNWTATAPAIATVTYAGRVPDDADEGKLAFDGTVATPDDERPVDGDVSTEVVADVFERVFALGEVTERELRAAGYGLREGQLTDDQYRRITDEWLRTLADPDEREAVEDGTGEEAALADSADDETASEDSAVSNGGVDEPGWESSNQDDSAEPTDGGDRQ